MGSQGLTLTRWETGGGVHEQFTRADTAAAVGSVRRYAGYDERAQTSTRREMAQSGVSLVLAFGDPLLVADDPSDEPLRYDSFVVGIQTRPSFTTFSGHQHGLQVDLTPAAARAVLDVPVDELTDRVVPLDEVLGRRGEVLVERLASLDSWPARVSLVDRVIEGLYRVERPPPAPEVGWLWRELADTHGNCRVQPLIDETGRSHRHVTACFRQQVGVSPKTCARLLRFELAVRYLRFRVPPMTLSDVAVSAGYYDQPHFNREFKSFAGSTPLEFLRGTGPTPEVSFLQDRRQPVL